MHRPVLLSVQETMGLQELMGLKERVEGGARMGRREYRVALVQLEPE